MEKRTRSPNYPAFGLRTAIEKVNTFYSKQHTHGAPREVAVKSMGYSGLNGASATAISAVMKYGLLERVGEDVKISERAMRILHPQSSEEKSEAILAAAMEPPLFRELTDKFPGRLPTDDVLRNYLIRNGFSPVAVSSVILSYRETFEFVDQEVRGYDSMESQPMPESPIAMVQPPKIKEIAPTRLINNENESLLGVYQFESGGSVRIIKTGNVSTQKALKMAEVLLNLMKSELENEQGVEGFSEAHQEQEK